MPTKRCACCGLPFEHRPQVPGQAFCSAPACQRTRKRRWQRDKLQSDPDYRKNQQAAQRAWTQRNQDYWRARREMLDDSGYLDPTRPAALNVPPTSLVKMDASVLPSGIYRITTHQALPREADGNSWLVEITLLRTTCPRKMDASRDDLIDTPAIRP